MNVYGSILRAPQLRFDFSSSFAVAANARQGLKQFGPFDSRIFPLPKITCGVLFPVGLTTVKTVVAETLTKGEATYQGFQQLFRVPLSVTSECAASSEAEMINKAQELARQDLDLIFVLTTSHNSAIYQRAKALFLGCGIPSQVLISTKIEDATQRPWILENVALASYAKVGGTPWVVSNPVQKNQLVLGVSRAQDKAKKFVIGFVTLFSQDGDFIFMHSKAPVPAFRWDDYVSGLTTMLSEAIQEYENRKGVPEEIVIHFHKRPGERELDAIEDALKNVGKQIPYALLHLNEFSNFRLFDTSDRTYVPEAGLKVELSRHEALLLLDGRVNGVRKRMGVPHVLDISMDKRSTLPPESFPLLVDQIYSFARVNWRGFNALSIPVTLNYSHLIAKMVADVGAEKWNEIIANVRLRDKSWFL
jgi:hypothetical protein